MESEVEDATTTTTTTSSRDSPPYKDTEGSRCSSKSNVSAKGSVKIKEEKQRNDAESIGSGCSAETPHKVPNRIIANWRHACDRTRDRTRDLLKRWRTLPEYEANNVNAKTTAIEANDGNGEHHQQPESGWSVHIWSVDLACFVLQLDCLNYNQCVGQFLSVYLTGLADVHSFLPNAEYFSYLMLFFNLVEATWVDRMSMDAMESCEVEGRYTLTPIQAHKFSHFFSGLLDHDQDELISEQDIQTLIERLRHFADWSMHSPEYNILREIERGFLDTFLQDFSDEKIGFHVNKQAYLTIDGWLFKWAQLIASSRNLSDFPVWLQYFVKVLFQVINRSASGMITRDELCDFYTSVLCLDATKVTEILHISYQTMTSNGDHMLNYKAYRLCFSNFLLGRYPNGPGQYIFGATPVPASSAPFPVDYSALNAQPEDLQQYAPNAHTNRRSVIV